LVQTGKSLKARGAAPDRVLHPRGADARVLRIIGGQWRGRKLRFPAKAPIRPTPDRVRETLFNWLAARVPGARCLDLFAGSGALGLEALSRGAAHVTFIERDPAAARALRARLTEWQAPSARVEQMDALDFLRQQGQAFDIVFLDPPFEADLLVPAARMLEAGQWLAPDALLYIEHAARGTALPLPQGWTRARAKQAGEVGYDLWVASAPGAA
jgi:16S rRNA (guanine966-N2)-methyltransferase